MGMRHHTNKTQNMGGTTLRRRRKILEMRDIGDAKYWRRKVLETQDIGDARYWRRKVLRLYK